MSEASVVAAEARKVGKKLFHIFTNIGDGVRFGDVAKDEWEAREQVRNWLLEREFIITVKVI